MWARQPLITPDGVDWLDRNHQWVWPVVGLIGAVVAVAALAGVLHETTATVTPRLCQALEIDHVSAAVATDLMPANRRIQ